MSAKTDFSTYVLPNQLSVTTAEPGDIFIRRAGDLGDRPQDLIVRPLANGVIGFDSNGVLGVVTTLTSVTITGAHKLGVQTLTGAGAISLTTPTTHLVTTGANALTLANGVAGQRKRIIMITDGGDGTLTPTTKTGFSTLTFNDAGDAVELEYINDTIGWRIVANSGATAA